MLHTHTLTSEDCNFKIINACVTSRFKRPISYSRAEKSKPTSPEQQNLNDRRSFQISAWISENNFKCSDMFLTLTFENNVILAYAKQAIKKYLKRLRYFYDTHGVELKYLYSIEFGESGRIHIHLLLNYPTENDLSDFSDNSDLSSHWSDICEAQWNEGFAEVVDITKLNGVLGLYIAKEADERYERSPETFGQRLWSCSRNLKRPTEKFDADEDRITRKQLNDLLESKHNSKELIAYVNKSFEGWSAVCVDIYQNSFTGLPYLCIKMVKNSTTEDYINFTPIFDDVLDRQENNRRLKAKIFEPPFKGEPVERIKISSEIRNFFKKLKRTSANQEPSSKIMNRFKKLKRVENN